MTAAADARRALISAGLSSANRRSPTYVFEKKISPADAFYPAHPLYLLQDEEKWRRLGARPPFSFSPEIGGS
jgi:hypothetical protein